VNLATAIAVRGRWIRGETVERELLAESDKVIASHHTTVRNAQGQNRVSAGGCVCARPAGHHRWQDYACPNPAWRCGNGQPQWLTRTYEMAPLAQPAETTT
jgi:hypothetical protein